LSSIHYLGPTWWLPLISSYCSCYILLIHHMHLIIVLIERFLWYYDCYHSQKKKLYNNFIVSNIMLMIFLDFVMVPLLKNVYWFFILGLHMSLNCILSMSFCGVYWSKVTKFHYILTLDMLFFLLCNIQYRFQLNFLKVVI
jgi:hypothetical protein